MLMESSSSRAVGVSHTGLGGVGEGGGIDGEWVAHSRRGEVDRAAASGAEGA